ncbi:hypothetical protein ACHAXA_005993 [Cyclostephanos tholiformis]|uniref:VLRF1 domain-containing protein n=1 Tax=Cyclostephanos tholiformis TaxID=382380 RepID=A0ABD3SR30_9STRA
MGNAPCVLIPLDDPSTTTGRMVAVEDDDGGVMGGGGQPRRLALAVPIALLPSYHRVRDETHASTARALLDAWDVWNGEECRDGSSLWSSTSSSSPTIIVVLLRSGRFASAVYAISKPNNSNRDDDDTSKSSVVTMIAHNTSTRYTIRKGQGGSQSNHDQSKNKAKSVGAQLRREGEKKLREDVHDVWREYRTRGYVSNSICVFVSCPRGMRKDYLYAPSDMSDGGGGGGGGGIKFGGLLVKGDSRWRDVPLDVGRPTLVAANAVLERLTSCEVRELSNDEWGGMMAAERRCSSITRDDDDTSIYVIARRRRDGGGEENSMPNDAKSSHAAISSVDDDGVAAVGGGRVEIENAPEPTPPYTPLHEAVMNGDLPRLMELLDLLDYSTGASSVDGCSHDVDRLAPESATAPVTTTTTTTTTVLDYDVNTPGGPDLRTPLHVASASSHPDAVAIVTALLVRGHANPCVSDGRSRKTPYFVARTDAIREAFRLARGTLGEDVWSWDDGAKVGPALTVEDVKSRRAKTMEKKRRQRARQKEARAEEKAEAEEVAAREKAELEERTKMEEARRIRDGLRPKGEGGSSSSSNACDYCQKVVRGKKRSQIGS